MVNGVVALVEVSRGAEQLLKAVLFAGGGKRDLGVGWLVRHIGGAARRAAGAVGRLGWAVAVFYRMRGFANKVSGMRPLLYTALGYAMAGPGDLSLRALNAVAVAGLLAFFGAYGNYWDWRLQDEHNGTRAAVAGYELSERTAFLLTLAPWGVILPLLALEAGGGASGTALGLFAVMASLGLGYIGPLLRLKIRPGGFLITPTVAVLLFLQAYALQGGAWSLGLLAFCGLLGLYQCQAEMLHLVDDHLHEDAGASAASIEQLRAWLRRLPRLSFVGAMAAALVHPLFLNTAVWALVRDRALRRLPVERASPVRRALWHPVWSGYEFLIYAVIGARHAGTFL